jgi:hypothetical protein
MALRGALIKRLFVYIIEDGDMIDVNMGRRRFLAGSIAGDLIP